jgi:hypothetical protein
MFEMFKRKKSTLIRPFEAALNQLLHYYEACMVVISGIETEDKEKVELAKNLFLLGAIDCSSQCFNLSDREFADLGKQFFQKIGVNDRYASVILMYFLNIEAEPAAMQCVNEGGKQFNRWIKGDKMMPLASMTTIMSFCNNPAFSKTIGDLYLATTRKPTR